MEVHQLRYFCAVAETGNFTRAAEREQVAQPSLSQQIMKLEEELGVRLFDRLGRSVRLTDVGQVFLKRARTVLGELRAAREEVAERQSTVSGPISVGVIPTIAPYFLPSRLALFSRKYPQVSITVVEDVTVRLMDRLRAGLIDLAVIALVTIGIVEVSALRAARRYVYFAMSSWMYLSKAAGVITIGVAPCLPQAAFTSGWLAILLTASLSLSTTARGVPLGAIRPSQMVAS